MQVAAWVQPSVLKVAVSRAAVHRLTLPAAGGQPLQLSLHHAFSFLSLCSTAGIPGLAPFK